MTDDIVARLRVHGRQRIQEIGWTECNHVAIEAADEIERLRVNCEERIDKLTQVYSWMQETAQDEIKRLRDALQWYADHCLQGGDDIEGPSGDYGRRARAALAGKDFVAD